MDRHDDERRHDRLTPLRPIKRLGCRNLQPEESCANVIEQSGTGLAGLAEEHHGSITPRQAADKMGVTEGWVSALLAEMA
jgi:hypothetical protein